MQDVVAARVWELAEPVATHEGMEIVDIEYRREAHGAVLRLYIDREGGVSLEDLSRLSRQVSDLLDVHDVVKGRYTLECSSPGIKRRLRLPAHFARFVGERVRIKLAQPDAGRRAFVGVLTAADDDSVTIAEANGQTTQIRLANIARANYEPEDVWGGKPSCNRN